MEKRKESESFYAARAAKVKKKEKSAKLGKIR